MDPRRNLLCSLLVGVVLAGCGEAGQRQVPADTAPPDASAPDSGVPFETPLPGFCARPDQDAVRDVFCGDEAPVIRSLSDLQTLLHISPSSKDEGVPYVGQPMPDNPFAAQGRVAIMGHSTSLMGELVSPINPRVIILGSNTFMAYVRGVQRIELISSSRAMTKQFNFYVLSFQQKCNEQQGGCTSGDLFTERVESGWTRVRIQDGEELKNTPLDCRVCHQGKSELPQLLMRELESPWTHFFLPTGLEGQRLPGVGGADLMNDYKAAKGGEIYGGYDLSTISAVSPFIMQRRVGVRQPLFYDSAVILRERYPNSETSDAQPSPTWEAGYEAFKRGEQLALPYFDQRATDLDKQAKLSDAYRRYREGELDSDELPDLSDIYPEDPMLRARMGLQTEPDANAQDVLIQACGSCHNNVLDQSISRARFNIDVSKLDRAELDLAIDRIQRDRSEPGVMPPREARQLDSAAREQLIEYLSRDHHEVDERLQHAAEMGMAGGEVIREVLF